MKEGWQYILQKYRRIVKTCADLLFPLQCVGCEVEGFILCDKCQLQVVYRAVLKCPVCGKINFEGRACLACSNTTNLDLVFAGFDYNQLIISKLIKKWKYEYIYDASIQIEKLLNKTYAQERWIGKFSEGAVIVPVPLHNRRLCERGFNQALNLALLWSKMLNVPVLDCLKRTFYTSAQAKQTGIERRALGQNIFVMNQQYSLSSSKILLVDDVFTTGSTLERAAQTLRLAGAEHVYGFVYAREA